MAEPKKRLTSHRSGNRRSHLALKATSLGTCPKCKMKIKPHFVCANCGFYNGKDVLELDRLEREKKERKKAKETKETNE